MLVRMLAIIVLLTFATTLGVPAQAFEKDERNCAAAKLKATGKMENAKLKCEAVALLKDYASTNADCLAKAEEKFATAFQKADEKGGCLSLSDAATVEAAVDEFVTGEIARQRVLVAPVLPCDVLDQACGTCADGICAITDEGQMCVATTGGFVPCPAAGCPVGYACFHVFVTNPLGPPIDISSCQPACNTSEPPVLDAGGRLCAASKLKATGKNALSKLKCEAKAIVKELEPTDPECLGKADTKLATAFEKAEAKGGCVSTGDATDVDTKAGDFVAAEVLRQTGALIPGCSTPDVACGSCGAGMCMAATEGLFCVDTAVSPVSPCPVDGCPAGTMCLTAGPYSACVTGCP